MGDALKEEIDFSIQDIEEIMAKCFGEQGLPVNMRTSPVEIDPELDRIKCTYHIDNPMFFCCFYLDFSNRVSQLISHGTV